MRWLPHYGIKLTAKLHGQPCQPSASPTADFSDTNLLPLGSRSSSHSDAFNSYMARSRQSPPMRDQWRAEDDSRARPSHRDRQYDRIERRERSPPRPPPRDDRQPKYRSRHIQEEHRDSHRLSERAGDTCEDRRRRLSVSPRQDSKTEFRDSKSSRSDRERIPHSRDRSPVKSHKRRRTRSPSSDYRYRSGNFARVPSRSRDRLGRGDGRTQHTGKAFSPLRSPTRDFTRIRKSEIGPANYYVPSRRRHSRSRSPKYEDRRARSPHRRTRSPHAYRESGRGRHLDSRPSSRQSHRSRLSARSPPPRTSRGSDKNMHHPTQRISSIMEDPNRPPSPPRHAPSYTHGGHDPMEGSGPQMRGSYGIGMNRGGRASRGHINSHQYSSHSTPYQTPNGSFQGSPPTTPYSQGRGGWNTQQQQHPSHG